MFEIFYGTLAAATKASVEHPTISIFDQHAAPPQFDCPEGMHHTVAPKFDMTSGNYAFSDEQVTGILSFVKRASAAGHRAIIVHCNEGRMRSPAVANALAMLDEMLMEDQMLPYPLPGCNDSVGDRNVRNEFRKSAERLLLAQSRE